MRKVALVTGSNTGIGKETIILFAKNNYDVIITYYKSIDEANKLKQDIINNYNVKCETIKCDISNEEDVKNLYNFVLNKFKKLDVLVNNAAVSDDMILEFKKIIEFKKVIDVNLTGTFMVTKYLYKLINKGCIINVGSTNGIDTYYPESIDYDASKAGIISLTHNFATMFSPKIRVNAVCPGWVETRQNKNLTVKQINILKKNILLKRFAQPQEIAKVIYFIANDATYINNSIIRVDGGSKC